MPTEAQINNALADLVADGGRLNSIINGDSTTDVLLEDGISSVPTVAKLFAGISNQWRSPAHVATTGALPNAPVYANGTAGLGATLTGGTNGALTIDGVAVGAGDRVLIKDEAAQANNGLYAVTNPGTVSAPYVLTRATDADTSADLVVGLALAIQQGAVYAGATFVMSTPLSGSITVGTSAIVFRTQASLLTPTTLAGILLSAGVTLTGAHSVVSSESGSIYNLAGNAYYTLTFGDPGVGFGTYFVADVFNADASRAKFVNVFGQAGVKLYPGQSVTIKKVGSAWAVLNRPGRWLASITLNVDPVNGADDTSVDGLATGTAAFKTIGYALTRLSQDIDIALGTPVIQLADGSYSVGPGITLTYPFVGKAQVFIRGNPTTPANVVVSCDAGGSCFSARDLSTTTLIGMTFSTTGNGSTGLSVSQGAVIDIQNWAFNGFPLGTHVSCGIWSSVNFLTGGTINGGAVAHIVAVGNGGYINYGSFNVQGAAGMAFTFFAEATDGGEISAGGVAMTFTGFASVTGQKYIINYAGRIHLSGAVYPGSTAGTVDATTFGLVN